MGASVLEERFQRWKTCSLCEQKYHGVVIYALGWACWKTYVGLPETHELPGLAISVLGQGLYATGQYKDAISVQEAELALERRVGAPEESILTVQSNLANTYIAIGRKEQAMSMRRDIYSGRQKLSGEENERTILSANNYAVSLNGLQRCEESKKLLRKILPVARRVLGESNEFTLRMKWNYADALYKDDGATLDDLREAVTTLEDVERTTRRVFGGAHPITGLIGGRLYVAREALAAFDAP